MNSIENPTIAALAKKNESKNAERPADLETAKKLEQEAAKTIQGRGLEDMEVAELKKVLTKYQEIERVLGITEEELNSLFSAVWLNPETQKEQAIEIDLEKTLVEQKTFYKNRLNLEIDESQVREIWNKNYAEIKSEIEKYGYDSILIVPDNLPEEEILNRDLIESMEEKVGSKKEKVAATWQGGNFESGGSFAGVKNSYPAKYRLVLTHSVQNIEDHPILKATLGKNVMQVTGLDAAEVERRIASGEELPVNCKIKVNGQEFEIKAEGESLEEYQLQQVMYFEKTGEHLDKKSNSYVRLLKSCSDAGVVDASWDPGGRELAVDAGGLGVAGGALGLRLSRSFSN